MLESLVLFAGIFFVSAATPGPDMMLLTGRALTSGARAALPYAGGIVIAKLALLTAAAVGVAAATAALGGMFVVLKIAGAVYLLFLGIRLWRLDGVEGAPGPQDFHHVSPSRAVTTGFVLGLSNPQAILFYVAILPTVVGQNMRGVAPYILLGATLVAVMVIVVAGYLTLARAARRSLQNRKHRRAADRVTGSLMVAAGVIVVLR